jgi:hypothetical protein
MADDIKAQATDLYGTQTSYAKKITEESLRDFSECQTYRNTTAAQWQEISELILPVYSNTFYHGSYNFPGQKLNLRQIDANGQMALHRFAAICDSLLTPRNMFWHGLEGDRDYLMKDRSVRVWYEQATKTLFKQRYAPHANFAAQNYAIYNSLGAFGTGGMFVDGLMDNTGARGLRYKAVPLGELYIKENHQGQVDSFIRAFRLTGRQAVQQFGEENLPAAIVEAYHKNSQTPYLFLHRVVPRSDDYDPRSIGPKGKRWASYYIAYDGHMLVSEGGYSTFPMAISRYDQAPGETYGRSPAMMVLPALKTLNAQKTTFLKQGHRAADPIYLLNDDGLMDFNSRPGAFNRGGVNADGKAMVQILPTGNIQINKEMMDEEKGLIGDAFLVTLFQILEETPQMTATEVIERVNEKGILLAPTVGRQQSEYLGPLIDRELDVLQDLRMLPPMPQLLREAKGAYNVVYTSPLSRAMRAQEAAGFMRTVESVKELVNITGDASLLDPFNFDVAVPAIADIQAVPASWMSTDGEIKTKRQGRARAQQQDAAIKAMPAQAAMIKAQAQVQKAQPGIAPGEQGVGGPVEAPAFQ